MTRTEAVAYITNSRGRWVTVEFMKRTDGTRRLMLCRLGVKKHLKGGQLPFDPRQQDLIVVWDRHKSQYRMIPVEGILRVKVQGKWRKVDA